MIITVLALGGACGHDSHGADGGPGGPDAKTPDGGGAGDAGAPDAGQPDAAPPTYDCSQLPAKPKVTLLPNFVGTEDIAFDDAGNVIESDQTNIYKTTRAGMRKTFVPNLPFRAGMRLTKSGYLIVNDESTGTLWRIAPNGSRKALMTGLSYPNGMEIGKDDFAYFTDQSAGKVYRVNTETGENTVLTTGVPEPNGLTFSVNYDKLYIGSFGGTLDQAIYQLEMSPNGTPGALSKFKTGVGTGSHDGMAVDACGNLYVADYGDSKVYRITPSGSMTAILEGDPFGLDYHANFDWGRGVGGWETDHLYVLTVGRGIKELQLSVPSKPRK
jgi:DNA-binding beta-propeller fold protein YncE